MIRPRKKYRLWISGRLAATAAVLLFVSSVISPISPMPERQSAEMTATQVADQAVNGPADQAPQQNSVLEGAVAELASAVSKSGSKALNISSLIFRF